ncbi:MAG TPA: YidB family protein [Eoetvoesiella sp.]
MGLLDSVISAVGGGSSQAQGQASLLPALIQYVNNYPGGLSGLIEKFQQGGLSDVIASWIGTGQNLPISGDQLQSVLGDSGVREIAQNSGMDNSSVLSNLSALLPGLVDNATPDGRVSTDGGLDTAALMGSLSGLLGKL